MGNEESKTKPDAVEQVVDMANAIGGGGSVTAIEKIAFAQKRMSEKSDKKSSNKLETLEEEK